MKKTYGKRAKQVFYASKNAGRISGVDKGFYSHMTHASLQKNEESVHVIGTGFSDMPFPKSPRMA
jgi:hypothetical protein